MITCYCVNEYTPAELRALLDPGPQWPAHFWMSDDACAIAPLDGPPADDEGRANFGVWLDRPQ